MHCSTCTCKPQHVRIDSLPDLYQWQTEERRRATPAVFPAAPPDISPDPPETLLGRVSAAAANAIMGRNWRGRSST